MPRRGKSDFEEFVMSFFLEQVKSHPAIWCNYHPDKKDTRGKVRNDWLSIEKAIQMRFNHQKLKAIRLFSLEDLKRSYLSKKNAFQAAVRTAKRSRTSLSDYQLAMQSGDERMRFYSVNMPGSEGHINMISKTPASDTLIPEAYDGLGKAICSFCFLHRNKYNFSHSF